MAGTECLIYDPITDEYCRSISVCENCSWCPRHCDCAKMIKAIAEYDEAEAERYAKNWEFLASIQLECSPELWDDINEEIVDCGYTDAFRITDKPYGVLDRDNVWIDQRQVGDSGDSFEGTVSMKLSPGRFLTWNYWM